MNKKPIPTEFAKVWHELVPSYYDKTRGLKLLMSHWGITKSAVFHRIKAGSFKPSIDTPFFFYELGINYSLDQGFFFDAEQYERIITKQDLQTAEELELTQTL